MKSLFAQDAMQSRHGVTSLRYEDHPTQTSGKAVARSLARGGAIPAQAPNTSPLQTAFQYTVMTYKGENAVGLCVVAVCIPRSNTSVTTTPLIAIIDREKRPQCRIPIDGNLQLLQNPSEPQYASLYDPNFGGHWSLMFKGRRECTEFVAGTFTVFHSPRLDDNLTPLPFVEWDNGTAATPVAHQDGVSRGDVISISFTMWLLRRVSGTTFFALGKIIEEVPPDAPREVTVADGSLMAGVEEALIGLRGGGASRLVFVPPRMTRVLRGIGNPEVLPSDTVVVHVSCHEVVRRVKGGGNRVADKSVLPSPAVETDGGQGWVAATNTPAPTANADNNALLQVLLLQTIQQQQQQQSNNAPRASGGDGGVAAANQLGSIERSIERVQCQLATLYEKIDRLAIEEKIEKNNAAIERMVKKAVGKAPTNDVDAEDMMKDRDGLLATIERLKRRLEEETANYHRALEAISRHKDEVHGLQKDLLLQRETHEARVKQLEEQRRLRAVESEVQHQQAMERISEEKYREGREAGARAAREEMRQKQLSGLDGDGEQEWRQRLFASEQRAVQLEAAMHEIEGRHIAERRQLQEHIDATEKMNAILKERLGTGALGAGALEGVHLTAAEAARQQCAVLRRAMKALMTNVQTQVCTIGSDKVAVEDVLRILGSSIEVEVDSFTAQIMSEAQSFGKPTAALSSSFEELNEGPPVVGDLHEDGVPLIDPKAIASGVGETTLQCTSEGTAGKDLAGMLNDDIFRVSSLPPVLPRDAMPPPPDDFTDYFPEPPDLMEGDHVE
uniref:peptidylprolyl isomerase n=1 Tax=Trypanosoma vivax (strain Y486) TaxID=1055687 RepID=G0UAP3_TRYVY|nr:conserved hypothetical protein [Trypanosoma vivax Y486]